MKKIFIKLFSFFAIAIFAMVLATAVIKTSPYSFAQETQSNTEWDKSELVFDGNCGGDCEEIHARVCNYGRGDMQGTAVYEVWYAPQGNPENGSVVFTGTIQPLAKNECIDLSYDPGAGGNYKFRVYQRPGYPDQHECWSSTISVNECIAPTETPTPTGEVTPTQTPTEAPTITLPNPTNTPGPNNEGGGGGGTGGGSNPVVESVQQATGEVLGTTMPRTGLSDSSSLDGAITGTITKQGTVLSIPKLGLQKQVSYAQYVGSEPLVAADEVMEMGTANNRVFYGHNTHNMFEAIGTLKAGDEITYTNNGVTKTYKIDNVKTVSEKNTAILSANNPHIITLITCDLSNPSLRTVVTASETAIIAL